MDKMICYHGKMWGRNHCKRLKIVVHCIVMKGLTHPEGKEETNLEDLSKRSIIDMARGAIKERVDYEMTRVVENILDPNTSATAARKITITLNLKPDDTRQNIAVSCVAKSTLAATNPVTTALYVADEESIVEMVPQIPGQLAVDASEQEAPPMLKLIQTA